MANKPKEFLTVSDQEWSWVIADALESVQIDQTLQKIGFSRTQFMNYLKDMPERRKEFEQAVIDSCVFIEDQILNAHKTFKDVQKAKLFVDSAKAILAFRKPEKYGNKIDVNMNKTVSIKHAISLANDRISKLVKDVITIPITPGGTKQQK